jgi:hypothetical protein
MAALEKHFTVTELATLWQLSEDSIRRIFRDHPGVLKLSSPEKRFKRGYCVLRIPESIVQKVHADMRGRAA